MLEFLKQFHGYGSFIVLGLTIILTVITLFYFIKKKEISAQLKKLSFITVLFFHIQMLMGAAMLFLNSNLLDSFTSYKIENKVVLIEHVLSLFTSVLLITIFNVKMKKNNTVTISMLVLLGIIILLFARVIPLVIEVIKPI